MKRIKIGCGLGAALTVLAVAQGALAAQYAPEWSSLNSRPCPSWWKEAKFGIFIHWGLYSAPAYAPVDEENVYQCYAEHYANPGRWLKDDSPTVQYHRRHYSDRGRLDFTDMFTASEFQPAKWAKLFKAAGAKYVVLTSKHHEGFALWPSACSPYFNAKTLGPKRDICGELTEAVRAEGMRMGFYYSLLEWYHPLYRRETIDRFVAEVNLPQLRELVNSYRPDIVWTDGEWDYSWRTLRGPEFLAWLYNESPVGNHVVANDRWGLESDWTPGTPKPPLMRGKCGDHYTSEYDDDVMKGKDSSAAVHPWEECRGIGKSFGYNRMEGVKDYLSDAECIETLVEKCSRGGNLLLNVGPTADGRIPPIMEERLLAIGDWLKVNGEAIYATTAWKKRPGDMRKRRVYYTQGAGALYVHVFSGDPEVRIGGIGAVSGVSLLGSGKPVDWRQEGDDAVISVPSFRPGTEPCRHALVFRVVCQG